VRIAAAAALIALVVFGIARYTIDLRHARSAAVLARAEAEARREKANELVAMMIEDMHPRLESVGRVDILDAVDAKALEYFASIEPNQISPRELAVNVKALTQLGRTQISRVNVPASLNILRQAVTTVDAAVRRHPDDEALLYAAADAHSGLCYGFLKSGDMAGATEQARLYSQYSAELVRRKPNDLRYLDDDAAAHGTLCSLLDRSEDIAGSLREAEIDIAIRERALRILDSEPRRLDLVTIINKAGLALFKLGRFGDADARFREEHAILQAQRLRHPLDKAVLEKFAIWYRETAMLELAQGDVDALARHCAEFIAVSKQLTSYDPANLEWRQHLGIAYRAAVPARR